MSQPRAHGRDTAGAGLPRHRITRVRCTTLDPPLGQAACRGQMSTREDSNLQRARRYRRGSAALWLSASVLIHEVLSASYQCKLAASLGRSPSLVPVLPSRSCLSLHSRTISLTTARSPSRHSLSTSPSSSLLPSVYFSPCTFTCKHASFNLLRHRRAGSIEDTHFLPSFFTFPLGSADMQRRPHRIPSL